MNVLPLKLTPPPKKRICLKYCLGWLKGVCGGRGDQLLDVPFLINGELKPELIAILTAATYYIKAYCAIFPSETLPQGFLNSNQTHEFWPLIHALARHGVYAVDKEEQVVSSAALAQRTPFKEASHLALLDALMTAHISSVVTIPRVMRAVRRITVRNAAHELPSTVEEALLLWLCKVSEVVTKTHQQKVTKILQESDVEQRKNNRVQLLDIGECVIANPRSLVEAVAGGQSLAALLVHYCHHEFTFSDFHFKASGLSQREAIENITKFANFAEANLPAHSFYMQPEVLVDENIMLLLHTNILALLARIYSYFEPSSTSKVGASRIPHSTPSDISNRATTSNSDLHIPQFENTTKQTMSEERHLLPLRKRCSIISSSQSASVMPAEQSKTNSVMANCGIFSHSLSSVSPQAPERIGVFKHIMMPLTSKKKENSIITASLDNLKLTNKIEVKWPKRGNAVQGNVPLISSSLTSLNVTSSTPSCGSPEPELKRSFTISKQHTVASATKAGLPIIGDNELLSVRKENIRSGGQEVGPVVLALNEGEMQCDNTSIHRVQQINAKSTSEPQIQIDYGDIVYVPETANDDEIDFDQYLMQCIQTETKIENIRQKKWRQRIWERNMNHTEIKENHMVSEDTNSLLVTSKPIAFQSLQHQRSTTLKEQESVATETLPIDPQTNHPLTPIMNLTSQKHGVSSELMETPNHNHEDSSSRNPWSSTGFRDTFTPLTPNKEMETGDLLTKRQHLVRERIAKRQHDRRTAHEHRKRENIIRDIRALEATKGSDQNDVSFSIVTATGTKRSTAASSPCYSPYLSPFLTHNGPECYVKPLAKSNRKLVRNALCHVCLAGEVNLSAKQSALTELDACNALHFFILLKHVISFKFRALYSYSEEGKVSKIFGNGPKVVQEDSVGQFYKYNSGSKEFSKIHSRSFSLSLDAFTLKQEPRTMRRIKHS